MAEGSDALLDRLDRVMADDFEAKMLGRVGRGAGEPDTSQSSLCCLDLQTRDL